MCLRTAAEVARKRASRLRLKLYGGNALFPPCPGCEEASVASAIETVPGPVLSPVRYRVARKQASRLRLKPVSTLPCGQSERSCEEASVASAIETWMEIEMEKEKDQSCEEASVASAIETHAARPHPVLP